MVVEIAAVELDAVHERIAGRFAGLSRGPGRGSIWLAWSRG